MSDPVPYNVDESGPRLGTLVVQKIARAEGHKPNFVNELFTCATTGFSERPVGILLREAAETIERWESILSDELCCTLQLMEALGIESEVANGRAVQEAMLSRIAFLKSCERKCCGDSPERTKP